MFYIKTKLPSGKTVKTEITDENVYTRCPECGREIPVDLAKVFSDGEGDLFSTSIICSACTKKRVEQRERTESIPVTINDLTLFSDMLRHSVCCPACSKQRLEARHE